MYHKRWLSLIIILLLAAACASAPIGPFNYTPDENKIKGYQREGMVLKSNIKEVEMTAEPLDMIGLTKVLHAGDKMNEVGFIEGAQKKIANNMGFYVTVENKGKGQVMFNPERARLIYERKNWYKFNSTENITPLDFGHFQVFLSKIKGGGERLEMLRNNLFHGTVLLNPGQKKSGMIFFPWEEKDEDLIYLQLFMPQVHVGKENVDFAFTFKVEPVGGLAPKGK